MDIYEPTSWLIYINIAAAGSLALKCDLLIYLFLIIISPSLSVFFHITFKLPLSSKSGGRLIVGRY